MGGEGDTQINPTEAKASQVKAELDAVWNSEITVENIGSYTDVCLNRVIDIINNVTLTYFPGEEITATSEDLAMEAIGFDVSKTLDSLKIALEEKRLQIEGIFSLVENAKESDLVLVPPGEGNILQPNEDVEKKDFSKKFIPKIETIIYIFVHDLNIPLDEIKITKGMVNINMFRKFPYVRLEADGKIIYVCNEYANATFIFTKDKLPLGTDVETLDQMNKENLLEIIKGSPGDHFSVINYGNWREKISKLLRGKVKKRKDLDPNVLISVEDKSSLDYGYAILDGEKWGASHTIQRKENIDEDRIGNMLVGLETRSILIAGVIRKAFRVSDVLQRDKKRGLPTVDASGDWKSFVLFDGKHYGSIFPLSQKLGVHRKFVLKLLESNEVPSIMVSLFTAKRAYSYEDVEELLKRNHPRKRSPNRAK